MNEILRLVVLIIHVIGATVIIGSSFVTLLVFFKKNIPWDNLKLLEVIWKLLGPAVGIQTLTGVYLAASEWDKFGRSHAFWTKMALYIADGMIAEMIIRRRLQSALSKQQKEIALHGISVWTLGSFLLLTVIAVVGVILTESGS